MNSTTKRQHEEFDVHPDKANLRKKVIRQDRLNVEDLDCWIEWQGKRAKVLDISPFGLAVKTAEVWKEGDEFRGVLVGINAFLISESSFKVVRQTQTLDSVFVLGLETLGEPIPVDRLSAVRDAQDLLLKQKTSIEKTLQVPPEFRRRVLEIRDWLESLQKHVNGFEAQATYSGQPIYEEAFAESVSDFLVEMLPAKNAELNHILGDANGEGLKNAVEYFREKLSDLIYQAPFSNRVYHKPLGYAGDFEMMNIIYREKAKGDSLFAKCLNHYWLIQPAAQAVRNRAEYLMTRIHETFASTSADVPAKFMSVACGPAMEWQRMIGQVRELNPRSAQIHLLDQDEGALKHAQREIRALTHENPNRFQFKFVNSAIKNVIARGLDERDYDLIYSAGLFDYFSDPVAQMAARRLFEALKPGGKLVIGNFNVSNPNSTVMNLALDWHLIYRSEEDLRRLFEPLGGKLRVDKESLDINLFCVISKE